MDILDEKSIDRMKKSLFIDLCQIFEILKSKTRHL
jgi:hypothetical protein